MNSLYLVRHGETEWNKLHRVQGKKDVDLSPKGIWQAEMLAKRLEVECIDIVYTSTLGRAKQTAQKVASHLNLPLYESEAFTELGLGPWEGLTINEITAAYNDHYTAYKEDPVNFLLDGAETFNALTERTFNVINTILHDNKGKNILLVSHSVTLKTIIVKLLNLDINHYRKFRIDNASISQIRFYEGKIDHAIIYSLNDTCHLR